MALQILANICLRTLCWDLSENGSLSYHYHSTNVLVTDWLTGGMTEHEKGFPHSPRASSTFHLLHGISVTSREEEEEIKHFAVNKRNRKGSLLFSVNKL